MRELAPAARGSQDAGSRNLLAEYCIAPLFCFGGGEPHVEGPRAHVADLRPPTAANHSAVAGDGDHGRDPGHFVLAPQITAVILQ